MRADTTAANSRKNISRAAANFLTGLIVGIITSIILLLIFSFIMTVRDIPEGVVPTLSAISVSIGSIVGGFVSAKMFGKSGLIVGALIGLVLFLIMMLAGAAVQGNGAKVSALIKAVVSLVSGGIGGVVGVNSRRSQKL
ncbi:hypothetical protein CCDG5_1080 [[Clostridium] cellulosi]|uniref:TIGR04086 family membrane protein n=1 Tax=[Clostridium] cellulosi TaxID=29343 RepID=A0A078KNS8_9FIRM|nr:hypothetical protein CCDG5_1080 [[Clostridium] cellulosi]